MAELCGWPDCDEQTGRATPLHTPDGVKFLCSEDHRTLLFKIQPDWWKRRMLASPEVRAAVTLLRRAGVGAHLN